MKCIRFSALAPTSPYLLQTVLIYGRLLSCLGVSIYVQACMYSYALYQSAYPADSLLMPPIFIPLSQ